MFPPGRLTTVLAALLVLTGAAGLIYQVVWFRVLGLIFGVTVYATSAVLAAFMAGLAVGSLGIGRVADRLSNPLRAYGLMELCIGATGFASLYAFEALQPLYRDLAPTLDASPFLLTSVRFVLAFGIMLVPTTLMGATLPMAVRAAAFDAGTLSRSVSLLYAFNTIGAIGGAFTAGFFLIGLAGTGGTVAIAALLNLLVGAACLLLARTPIAAPPATTGRSQPAPPDDAPLPAPLARAILITYGVSGAVALAYEVVWTRVLALVLPQTVYAFALMLCAILSGIAAGSWLMERLIARRANWVLIFAMFEVALGLFGILSATALSRAYGVEALFRRLLGLHRLLLAEDLWFMTLFAFITVFPAALFMGTTFPVAAKLYGQGHAAVGVRVGTVYGANVLGAIVGSLLAGLALIPALGSQGTVWLLGGLNVLLGLFVLAIAAGSIPPALRWTISAGAVLAAFTAAAVTPDLYTRLFSSHPRGEQVVWYDEGEDATIRVVRTLTQNLVLYVNSQGQATDVGTGLRFHRAVGHLPALLHPNPKEALVVGLGGGATAGAVATHPGLNVTVAELHAGVIVAARHFAHVNYRLHDRPNVTLTVNDGRNHLLVTRRRYDLIQGDIIPPGNAGAANLYSAEYYRLARGALNPGGLMVQWVDSSLPEYQWKLLLRSFLRVFPNATLWGLNGSMIVGSVEPLRLDRDILAAKYRALPDPGALDELQMGTPDDLLRQFMAHPHELAAYVGDGPIISDRNPAIEYTRTLPSGARPNLDRFSRDVRPLLTQ